MSERAEVWERIYLDSKGQPTRMIRSTDKGKTWEPVDCSAYPEGKPPFIFLHHIGEIPEYMELRNWR